MPDDLKSSDVHQMIEDCHVCLCVSTFKRNFQLKEALALNMAQTWAWRRRATWCIFDANSDTELMEWTGEYFRVALQTGHIIWLRAVTPWETFHCSVAKNTAHMSGFLSNVTDRIMTVAEAGLTATEADLTARTFVMNWDNDNVLSLRWLYDCLRAANHMISTTNLNSATPYGWLPVAERTHWNLRPHRHKLRHLQEDGRLRRKHARHGLPGCGPRKAHVVDRRPGAPNGHQFL